MDYRLVPAVDEDQAWLEKLRRAVYRDLFFATWGQWDEARHLRHCSECWDEGGIFCVEVDGERVGMLQLFERPTSVVIGEIQIAPRYQGRGIGTVLLRDTISGAHAKGKKVSLSTGLKNHRAFALYTRLGFRHIGKSDTHDLLEFVPPEYVPSA
jgi:ribosomal protein S18 acetylase RimI-like enzyme